MRQIAQNPAVGIAADWFTAHGVAENLGYLFAPENAAMASAFRTLAMVSPALGAKSSDRRLRHHL